MKARVNGAEIFFDVEGAQLKVTPNGMEEKPVMVALHGGPGGDHTVFRPWLSSLADDMQLIYVDHRGTGRSGKVPPETCTIEQMADDIDALRRSLGIEKWNVLGISYGGMWALTYATKYNRDLSHLIALDTTACWKEDWKDAQEMAEKMGTPEQKRVFRDVFLGKVGTPEESRRWYEIMGPLYYHRYKEEYGEARKKRTKGSPEVSQYMWKNIMSRYDIRGRLKKITVPTFVGVGRYDWVTPVRQSEYLVKQIPNAKLTIYEKSGHIPFIEENGKFLRDIREFLGLKDGKPRKRRAA